MPYMSHAPSGEVLQIALRDHGIKALSEPGIAMDVTAFDRARISP